VQPFKDNCLSQIHALFENTAFYVTVLWLQLLCEAAYGCMQVCFAVPAIVNMKHLTNTLFRSQFPIPKC